MVLVKLFLSFLRIGLFAIGGAYSFLPLIEREVVQKYNWLTKEEFLDVMGMVRLFPGAISIKYATYTGYKVSGIPGVIAANLGNILAPTLLILLASFLYTKYKDNVHVKRAFGAVEFAVWAMILAVLFQLINPGKLMQLKNLLIAVVSFILFTYTKVHPALIIISAGVIGVILK